MDIFFQDPSDVPLPPKNVRIREFYAQPWPDAHRVRVYLEITPFQKRPSGEIVITDDQGEEVANISIIETIDPKMDFTLHLRAPETQGEYTVSAKVFYPEFREGEDSAVGEKLPLPQPSKIMVVDRAETTFRI